MKRVRLQAELLLRRYGWLPIVTGLAVSAAIWLHGVVTARLLAESQNHRAMLQTLSQRPPSPIDTPHSLADTRYAAFQARLTKRENLPQIIKMLFTAAERQHLSLKQADYKLISHASGEYQVYRIVLPIKGGYADIRRFAATVLAEVDAVALEEIAFKREGIASPVTEANMHFAVYLRMEN